MYNYTLACARIPATLSKYQLHLLKYIYLRPKDSLPCFPKGTAKLVCGRGIFTRLCRQTRGVALSGLGRFNALFSRLSRCLTLATPTVAPSYPFLAFMLYAEPSETDKRITSHNTTRASFVHGWQRCFSQTGFGGFFLGCVLRILKSALIDTCQSNHQCMHLNGAWGKYKSFPQIEYKIFPALMSSLLLVLAGCGHNYAVIPDSNGSKEAMTADLKSCNLEATHAYYASQPPAGAGQVTGLVAGGLLGGAIGGAIAGAAFGIASANDGVMKLSDIDPYVDKCMAARGYSVVEKQTPHA